MIGNRRKELLDKANEIYNRAHPQQDMIGVMTDLAEWADANPPNAETEDYYSIRKDRYDLLVKTLKDIAMTDFSYGIQKKIKDTLEYVREDV